jgi:homogentisate 1,2-dioxygenase
MPFYKYIFKFYRSHLMRLLLHFFTAKFEHIEIDLNDLIVVTWDGVYYQVTIMSHASSVG